MRTTNLAMIIILLSVNISLGGELKPEDYTGEIVFNDSSKVVYNWLWSSLAGDKLYYTRKIESSRHVPSSRVIKLSGVSRMDFIKMTNSEKEKNRILHKDSDYWNLKAKITFHDGSVWDNIYLYGSSWKWGSTNEEGYVRDILSMTFNLKSAKKCPKCSRQFKEADWQYCPFDGNILK